MTKAVENETDPDQKIGRLHSLRHCEATREIYTSSIKQLNSLIQFDPEPNQMTEAKVELYKVTISFQPGGTIDDIESLPGSNHRVLFQNVDETINMGVIFTDPDLDLSDVYWYMVLAEEMNSHLWRNEGLITVDSSADHKWNTKSCYVEL